METNGLARSIELKGLNSSLNEKALAIYVIGREGERERDHYRTHTKLTKSRGLSESSRSLALLLSMSLSEEDTLKLRSMRMTTFLGLLAAKLYQGLQG